MTMLKLTVITVPDKCCYLDSVNSQITTDVYKRQYYRLHLCDMQGNIGIEN